MLLGTRRLHCSCNEVRGKTVELLNSFENDRYSDFHMFMFKGKINTFSTSMSQ